MWQILRVSTTRLACLVRCVNNMWIWQPRLQLLTIREKKKIYKWQPSVSLFTKRASHGVSFVLWRQMALFTYQPGIDGVKRRQQEIGGVSDTIIIDEPKRHPTWCRILKISNRNQILQAPESNQILTAISELPEWNSNTVRIFVHRRKGPVWNVYIIRLIFRSTKWQYMYWVTEQSKLVTSTDGAIDPEIGPIGVGRPLGAPGHMGVDHPNDCCKW